MTVKVLGEGYKGGSVLVTDLPSPVSMIKGLRPTAALAETCPRAGSPHASSAVLTSGRLMLTSIYLPASLTVTSISYISGNTGAGTPTNQWFALYDNALALLRQTNNDTTTAWGSNTLKTLNLSSTFVTTYSGLHYLGVMVTATTPPNLVGVNSNLLTAWSLSPMLNGFSSTSLTTTAPNPAAAMTELNGYLYAYVS